MKKIVFFLLSLCVAYVANAQDFMALKAEYQTKEECIRLADSLLKLSKRTFALKDSEQTPQMPKFILDYRATDAPEGEVIKLSVFFNILQKGANPSLEQKGTTVYTLATIYGKYLDIVPIWKTYIDLDADIVKIAESGRMCIKRLRTDDGAEVSFRLYPDQNREGIWILSL